MSRTLAVLASLAIAVSALLATAPASAVPKMDVKVAVGVGSTTLVSRLPEIDLFGGDPPEFIGSVGGRNPATFSNWGLFLSARVRADKLFGEVAIGFSRFHFTVGEELVLIAIAEGNDDLIQLFGETARMNSLEIPLTAGYVPYHNPYFKFFLYGGWVSTFNVRGFVELNGDRKGLKFKPKEIPGYPLSIYIAGFRMGSQIDLGPVNFDFNYTINLNSVTKTSFRTNAHVFRFLVGWLF